MTIEVALVVLAGDTLVRDMDTIMTTYLNQNANELSHALDDEKHQKHDKHVEDVSLSVVIHGCYPVYRGRATYRDEEDERHVNHRVRYAEVSNAVLPIL